MVKYPEGVEGMVTYLEGTQDFRLYASPTWGCGTCKVFSLFSISFEYKNRLGCTTICKFTFLLITFPTI